MLGFPPTLLNANQPAQTGTLRITPTGDTIDHEDHPHLFIYYSPDPPDQLLDLNLGGNPNDLAPTPPLTRWQFSYPGDYDLAGKILNLDAIYQAKGTGTYLLTYWDPLTPQFPYSGSSLGLTADPPASASILVPSYGTRTYDSSPPINAAAADDHNIHILEILEAGASIDLTFRPPAGSHY